MSGNRAIGVLSHPKIYATFRFPVAQETDGKTAERFQHVVRNIKILLLREVDGRCHILSVDCAASGSWFCSG